MGIAVTSCEINVPISPSNFEIVFPPGTRVRDEVKNIDYIVKPTGGTRVILSEDIGEPTIRC